MGVCPETGLRFASFRVMVTAEVSTPLATTGLKPVIVEFRATATPAVKTTVPSAFETGVAIERVFVSAVEDARVQVEIPEAFVTEQAVEILLVPVSVAENVGVWPDTRLLLASFKVMVIVEVATPSAITGPEPVMVELAATATPAEKTTVPSALITGVAMARVLTSAVKDVRVQVETPAALVTEQVV